VLPPLAVPGDLDDRAITVPDGMNADVVLASAGDAVRDAAGCPITEVTSTVVLVVCDSCSFDLPAGPVSDVASVVVGGLSVTGWWKVGDTVRMPANWTRCLPVEVTVTYTHGYPIVPNDIVDLVCGMAAMAFAADGDYGSTGRLASIRLGDFSESFTNPKGTESPSPLALPEAVRERLRARFGTSVALVGMR
jgi:hypothetical protein